MEKLVHKAEGMTQHIDTGMTLDEMWSKQASAMEILDKDKTFQDLFNTVKLYLVKQKRPSFVMLNNRKDNYMTIFQDVNGDTDTFAHLITDFLLVDMVTLGGLKMYSTEDNNSMIQLYIGNTHYALFNCEPLMVLE